ncbi:MAG TPA: hypothetical protein VGT44_01205, partial [Ktedonobacteraceae bacterium]|nr:hypothetical protein [Ktedonobacteraceae bacterium]
TTFDGKSGLNLALSAFWDGSKWHKVSNPNVAGSNNIFFGVAAVSAKNVLAVGLTFTNTGPDQTFSEQWNGTAWHILTTPDPSGSGTLTAVTRVPGASLYWAVGVSEGGGHNTLIESYC